MAVHKSSLVQPYYVSMEIISLFVLYRIDYSLSSQHELNNITDEYYCFHFYRDNAGDYSIRLTMPEIKYKDYSLVFQNTRHIKF